MHDEARANLVVKFIKRLKHTKDRWAGVPFNLQPWQERHIREIFGTVREDGLRQYRTVYWSTARKNGKSEIGAALALYLLTADGVAGAEVYSAASDRDQASIVFRVAAQMVRQNATLRSACKVIDSQRTIYFPRNGSVYRALSAEAASKHGYNPSAIIFDELHAQPNRDLWDVLTTGSGTRAEPLFVAITTAGFDRNSICWEQYEYAKKIASGIVQDPTFYPAIYETPEDADWTDEANWPGANPGLTNDDGSEGFRSLEEMRAFAARARQIPALQNTFRRLYLNQWTSQADRWIDMHLWDENAGRVDEDTLRGRTCYGGLDLASVSDLTAWVMVFPHEGDQERLDVLARFWVPEARLHDTANRYRDQYQAWRTLGWLRTTPGDAIDYEFIKEQILRDARTFNLVDINIDRLFQGHQLGIELMEEGLTVVGIAMGAKSLSVPMHELNRRLLVRKICHGNNPVMRFCADNVAVRTDANQNMRPDKAASQGKIDGIVALVLALDRAMRHEKPESTQILMV